MVDLKLLGRAGLTEGECKVNLALLETGQTSITDIIKKSGVSTSKSYDILHRLEEKGLVSHAIIRNVKHFKAANPQRLMEILNEKKNNLDKAINQIENIIPKLLAKQKTKEGDEEAEVFVGMKGLISVFNEETEWMKKTKKSSYVIGATKGGLAGKKIDEFFRRLQQKRDKAKLKTYFIFNEANRGKFPYLEKSEYCFIKYIKVGSEMTSINIFNNKTVIAIYSKQPFLFIIKSKGAANDFRGYFQVLWKQGKNK